MCTERKYLGEGGRVQGEGVEMRFNIFFKRNKTFCIQRLFLPLQIILIRNKQLIISLGFNRNKHAVIIRDTFVLCSRRET